MLYDLADIMALRFAGHVRNIPIELPQSFHGNVFSEETLLALCRQKVLAENRNHRSYSLTPAGIALLEHLGYTYQLDSRQPAQAKLNEGLCRLRYRHFFAVRASIFFLITWRDLLLS